MFPIRSLLSKRLPLKSFSNEGHTAQPLNIPQLPMRRPINLIQST